MLDMTCMQAIHSISVSHNTKKALKSVLAAGHSGRILGARLRDVSLDIYEVLSKLGSLGESYYRLVHGEPEGCKECGQPTKFRTVVDGYNKFCSRKCSALQPRGERQDITYVHPKGLNVLRQNLNLNQLIFGNSAEIRGRIKQKAPKTFAYIENVAAKLDVSFAQVLFHVATGNPIPQCPVCKAHTRFYSAAIGYKEYCSAACAQQCPDVREAALHSFHNRDKEKAKEKALKKYGVEHHTQSDAVKKLRVATCMEKYGVAHQLQNPDIAKKVFERAINHEKTEIHGCVFWLSGYEKHALTRLLKQVDAKRIRTIGHPEYRTFRYTTDEKSRVYYPDFIVGNTVIEVKSTYTCAKSAEAWWAICDKAAGVRAAGFKYQLWVFDKRGNLIAKPNTGNSYTELKRLLKP